MQVGESWRMGQRAQGFQVAPMAACPTKLDKAGR